MPRALHLPSPLYQAFLAQKQEQKYTSKMYYYFLLTHLDTLRLRIFALIFYMRNPIAYSASMPQSLFSSDTCFPW